MREVGFRPRDCYGSAVSLRRGSLPLPGVGHSPSAQLLPPTPRPAGCSPGHLLRSLAQPGLEPPHLLTCSLETSLHRLLLSPGVQVIVTSTRRPSGLCEDRPSLSFLPPGPHARSLSLSTPVALCPQGPSSSSNRTSTPTGQGNYVL